MKRFLLTFAISALVGLLLVPDLIGRGGRGGGGGGGARPAVGGGGVPPAVGGGGGGFSSGGNLDLGGARPGGGARPSTGALPKVGPDTTPRPSQGQLGNFLDLPNSPGGSGGRPGIDNRAAGQGPGAVSDFFQNRPPQGAGTPGKDVAGKGVAGKAAQLPGDRPLAQNRPDRVENRQQLQQQRQDRRQDVRDEFRDNHPRFDFAVEHPRWAAWRVNRPYRWATAAALTAWVGYGADAAYYDYGENIYYSDDAVYSDGQQIASADVYVKAAEQIATSIPAVKEPDWMPLGVFAVTQDGQSSGPPPTMFVQLTVSKQGIIAGTFQNTTAGTSQPVEGMVDKTSQRAAWVVSGKTRPIMEAGVFNLTKDTAPALVHFADGRTQQWLLIRMDEPTK